MQPSSLALYPLILGALTITMPALAETDPLATRRASPRRNSAVAVNVGGSTLQAACLATQRQSMLDPAGLMARISVPGRSSWLGSAGTPCHGGIHCDDFSGWWNGS